MVIVNNSWLQNASESYQENKMKPSGILLCHDNSYPFQERTLCLEQPIKIGRSVARARAAVDNAIFDCKVLSRNHALLWYDTDKFYIKDTKSSNGTFVNNKRLSSSGEESLAYEVCSGDIVQFGVDVVESTKKVTHGCIIASLKLYLPDGKEAKVSPTTSIPYVNITLEELYKLNQYIQEAGRREKALHSKLEYMQRLVDRTKNAANESWKALVLEDCLLSRLEMLESQVFVYSKHFEENKVRQELIRLLRDKLLYQTSTKQLLQKKVLEKQEFISIVQVLKFQLNEMEEETQLLHKIIKENQNELKELALKYIKLQQNLQETTDELLQTKYKLKEVTVLTEKEKQDLLHKLYSQDKVGRNLQMCLSDCKYDSINIQKYITALQNYMQTLQDIKYVVNNVTVDFPSCINPIDAINIILSKCNSICLDVFSVDGKIKINPNEKLIFNENIYINKILYHNKRFMNDKNPIKISMVEDKGKILQHTISEYTASENKIRKIMNKSYNHHNQILKTERKIQDSYNLQLVKNNQFTKFNKFKEAEISSIEVLFNQPEENINPVKNNINDNSLFEFFETPKKYLLKNKECLLAEKRIFNNKDYNQILNQNKECKLYNDNCIELYLYDYNFLKFLYLLSSFENNHSLQSNFLIKELQKLKQWLLNESNEQIIYQLEEKYNQFRSTSIKVQELSEQLVILKEQYNLTCMQKINLMKTCKNLEKQYNNFVHTSYMIPIQYVIPLFFAFIWMLLDKIY